ALDLEGLADDVVAQHQRPARAGRQQPGEDVDGGRFASAVGTQEAEEGALGYAQGQVIHGHLWAEAAGQAHRWPWITWPCAYPRAPSSASWVPTALANRPPSTSSPGCWRPARAGRWCWATTSSASPSRSSA